MEDAVMVSRNSIKSINCDDDETCSMDSSFSVVNKNGNSTIDKFLPPPSISTAVREERVQNGDRYEMRADIKELKKLRDVTLNKKLAYYGNDEIKEIKQRIDARRNLDEEIESEIRNINDLISNKGNEEMKKPYLLEAAETALENMKTTKTVAKEGETTLKRAMEIVQAAFPVFLSVWGKAQEEIKENDQVGEELTKFEEARYEVMHAGLDVEKRIQKSKEFKTHIDKAIELAEGDVERINLIHKREREENRMQECNNKREEIAIVVESEIDMVDTWLVTCKSDKSILDDMEKEQNKRHERATEDYQKQQEQFNRDLEFNKKHQDELKAELQKLKVKEEGMKENKIFQTEVQKRAEKLHEDLLTKMKVYRSELDAIQAKANTARQVVEKMQVCGTALIDSAMRAEQEFLEELDHLEMAVIETLRDAVVHSAVELRIKLENSNMNMNDSKENMKELKEKRKKAAERQNVMAAKRHEEEYNEYKDSYKKEKKIVDMCTTDFDVLMTKLGLLDEKLGKLGVEFKPFVDLYELRKQELKSQKDEGMCSLDISEDEDASDSDE